MAATLGELAERFKCRLEGSPTVVVDGVAALSSADASSISFFANRLFKAHLATTRAAAVIIAPDAVGDCPVASLVCDNPYATYARIAAFLLPPRNPQAGIHDSAIIAPSAQISGSAEIGPLVVVGERARVAAGAIVGAGAVIGRDVSVGAGTRIAPRVSLMDSVQVGERCVLHSGVVVGSDGFGFAPDDGKWVKVPQLGSVVIGDDVEIGANTTIDRGTIDSTIIEDGVKLDNLVQIAHNVQVGAHTVMAAMSGAAGSTKIGRRCMIGGGVVMINHLTICDDVLITFRTVVTKSITRPGMYSGSLPADEASQWRRNAARFRSLDKLANRLRAAEVAIRQLARKGKQKQDD
jgi:UDP-3-O-[3-hydroxymyristoyl] glucosamine N-acyltransferase